MARDREWRAHAHPRADGHRQDAHRVPLGAESAHRRRTARAAAERRSDSLHLAAQGAEQRHPAQSRTPARGAEGALCGGRRAVPGHSRRRSHRRHAAVGASANAPEVAARAHHDARVAAHHAHDHARPRDVQRRARGDRRRDPRDRGHASAASISRSRSSDSSSCASTRRSASACRRRSGRSTRSRDSWGSTALRRDRCTIVDCGLVKAHGVDRSSRRSTTSRTSAERSGRRSRRWYCGTCAARERRSCS